MTLEQVADKGRSLGDNEGMSALEPLLPLASDRSYIGNRAVNGLWGLNWEQRWDERRGKIIREPTIGEIRAAVKDGSAMKLRNIGHYTFNAIAVAVGLPEFQRTKGRKFKPMKRCPRCGYTEVRE